ncbi:dormancy-associated protein homolog 4-like isoform X2 [Rhodamnia argentea]|uniref:Dormancy-associated protein homolog 4-like isoform X2 n=1 Tax=Rhodamnia argentea TaxID=178133 RepID=A0A8B8PNZ2_9MYRT|nr:dormancy-associated protein homolog 4-like isoform X2 [Rhodamnia argentea]
MGLLHKLWDETFAGPTPESGLGKLRGHRSSSAAAGLADPAAPFSRGAGLVSRRITIVRTRNQGGMVGPDSVPEPPALSSSNPGTLPSPGTPQGDNEKLTRRKASQALQKAEPRSPTVFDWILISALDR